MLSCSRSMSVWLISPCAAASGDRAVKRVSVMRICRPNLIAVTNASAFSDAKQIPRIRARDVGWEHAAVRERTAPELEEDAETDSASNRRVTDRIVRSHAA